MRPIFIATHQLLFLISPLLYSWGLHWDKRGHCRPNWITQRFFAFYVNKWSGHSYSFMFFWYFRWCDDASPQYGFDWPAAASVIWAKNGADMEKNMSPSLILIGDQWSWLCDMWSRLAVHLGYIEATPGNKQSFLSSPVHTRWVFIQSSISTSLVKRGLHLVPYTYTHTFAPQSRSAASKESPHNTRQPSLFDPSI